MLPAIDRVGEDHARSRRCLVGSAAACVDPVQPRVADRRADPGSGRRRHCDRSGRGNAGRDGRRDRQDRAGGGNVRLRDPVLRYHDRCRTARPGHRPSAAAGGGAAGADHDRHDDPGAARSSRRIGRGVLPRDDPGAAPAVRSAGHGPARARLHRIARRRREFPSLDRADAARLGSARHFDDGLVHADDRCSGDRPSRSCWR